MRYTLQLQADGRTALLDDGLCHNVYPTTEAAIAGLAGILAQARTQVIDARTALDDARTALDDAQDEVNDASTCLETLERLYRLESQDKGPYTGPLTYCS